MRHKMYTAVVPWIIVAASLSMFSPGEAATPLDEVQISSDVTVDLSGAVSDDDDVVADDLFGTVTLIGIGNLPDRVDLDAYHRLPNGDVLFSLDTTTELVGGIRARPGDVVRFDGNSFALEFEAAAVGLPASVDVDAVGAVEAGDLLLSFDITVDLGGESVDDEDLVRFDGTGFTVFFDGSVAGVGNTQDLDAAHHLNVNGHLMLSFGASGTLGSVSFDDEDILEFDPSAGSWEIAYDGSSQHDGWTAGDLDAVYVVDASSGAVPNGGDGLGTPLTVDKSGTGITLNWGNSCISNDADYAVYEGLLGDLTSHVPIASPNDCTTRGSTTVTFSPRAGNRFYLVVPQGYQREGSYGTDSYQMERAPSSTACQPQLVGVCL